MDSGSDSDSEGLQAHKDKLEAEKQARMDSLVPTLPASDWGRKVHISEQSHQLPVAINQSLTSSKADGKKIDPLEFIPSKMRPPRFAKQEFDGVVSDSESDSESDLPAEGTWGRKVAQMKWSEFPPVDLEDNQQARIEEIEEEDEDEQQRKAKLRLGEDVDLEEEMQRRVWGDRGEDEDEDEDVAAGGEEGVDIDMEDETEEFLKFSREALGINDEMWEGILGDRRARGGELLHMVCGYSCHANMRLQPLFRNCLARLSVKTSYRRNYSHEIPPAKRSSLPRLTFPPNQLHSRQPLPNRLINRTHL